jgi:hypothetical protein
LLISQPFKEPGVTTTVLAALTTTAIEIESKPNTAIVSVKILLSFIDLSSL